MNQIKENSDKHKHYNRHLDTILDSIADGVFTIDMDFNITYFNRAAENITGISKNQAVGKKCFDVFRASICQNKCAMSKTMKTGKKCINLYLDILNCEGQVVPVSVSTSVLKNCNGEISGGAEIFRDLSTIETLHKEVHSKYNFKDIISKNHEIQRILGILPDIASSCSTVIIEGQSGTGKELFAKAIHSLSGQTGKYVAINCGALPDTLLESELFGYKKGAFSEAKKDKPGRFELAQNGTLFLDEIGDISAALQMKLLRVLQEKEYEPLGATMTVKSNARIIAATNRTLSDLVARGLFREDLFYRLNVVRIELPPLSQRMEDIPLLIEHFIQKFNALKSKEIIDISEDALSILMRYDFPGNIRELENLIEFAFILCHGHVIEAKHFPKNMQDIAVKNNGKKIISSSLPIDQAEENTIIKVLKEHKGNRSKTAAYLGINKSTLWRKMKKYGIT